MMLILSVSENLPRPENAEVPPQLIHEGLQSSANGTLER